MTIHPCAEESLFCYIALYYENKSVWKKRKTHTGIVNPFVSVSGNLVATSELFVINSGLSARGLFVISCRPQDGAALCFSVISPDSAMEEASVQVEDGQCGEVAGRARGRLLESSTAALLDECGLLESVTCQSPEERHVMKRRRGEETAPGWCQWPSVWLVT